MTIPSTSRAATGNAPAVGGGTGSSAGCRLIALMEITNFIGLRRVLGRFRADALAELVAGVAAEVGGAVTARAVGRTLVELELVDQDLPTLDARLGLIERHFATSIAIDGEQRRIEIAIGGAAAVAGGWEEVGLAEAAEQALMTAREEGRRVVSDVASSAALDSASLCRDLAEAIAREEIELHYQPKLHLRRQQVSSIEALARWRHPRRGPVPPCDFIPLAERTGLIRPLTLLTLRRAAADQRRLHAGGHDLPVFVNMSGQLLSDRAFIDEALALLSETGARIGIEITETSMIGDPQAAIECLKDMAARGIPIAIDDYGAGLSSLAYLKQLPACELKIDKMFVLELTSSHRDPLIVRSTIDLAHAMEMEVTAEGVETPAALALLTVMGCDLVQGFLLSRPLTLPVLEDYLARKVELPVIPSFDLSKRAFRRAS